MNYLQIGSPDFSITVSGSDDANRFTRLSESMKGKPSVSAPLLTSVGIVPTTSTTSSSSTHLLLDWGHSGTVNLTVSSSTAIWKTVFGYNGGFYGADVASPKLESVCARRELTSLDTNLDIFQWTTWLLHDGIIFLFFENSILIDSSLIILSTNNDVSMMNQGHVEERYSSALHFKILLASIC